MRRAVLTIALGVVLSAGFVGCSASGSTTEEHEMTMEQRERINPSEFIVVNAKYNDNLIGSNIEGTLFNKATRTNYKDVMVTAYFYDDAGTMLGSKNYVVSQDLNVGETENFKISLDRPDHTKNVTWAITGANPM